MNGTPHRTRALLAGCALVLGLAALTGCGGGDSTADPAPTPRFSSSAPTSASTTTPPAPASSSPPAAETPEAFIKRWALLEKTMENSGDSDAYRAITRPCTPCAETADQVDKIYSAGGRIRTDGRSILSIERLRSSGQSRSFRVEVSVAPTRYTESAGGPEKSFPGGRSTYEVVIRSTGGGWQVADYSKLAQ